MIARPDELLDDRAIGAKVKVAASTVAAWGRQGRIPRIRLGRKTIRYSWPAVLDALCAGHTCGGCGVPLTAATTAALGEHGRPWCAECSRPTDTRSGS